MKLAEKIWVSKNITGNQYAQISSKIIHALLYLEIPHSVLCVYYYRTWKQEKKKHNEVKHNAVSLFFLHMLPQDNVKMKI